MGTKAMLAGFAILIAVGIGLSLRPSEAAPASSASVTVDSVTWRVLNSGTTRRIENQYLGSTAKGIYLIMKIAATNGSGQWVNLSSDQAELEVNGADYLPDTSALNALELGGRSTLPATGLGPATTATGWVAFDVAPTALRSDPKLCFHEVGLAAVRGCVAAR
jgi:hypothetical protein